MPNSNRLKINDAKNKSHKNNEFLEVPYMPYFNKGFFMTESDENITSMKDNSTVNIKKNQVEKVKQESLKDPYRFRYIFYSIVAVIIIIGIGTFFTVKNKWFSFLKKLF